MIKPGPYTCPQCKHEGYPVKMGNTYCICPKHGPYLAAPKGDSGRRKVMVDLEGLEKAVLKGDVIQVGELLADAQEEDYPRLFLSLFSLMTSWYSSRQDKADKMAKKILGVT